MLNKPIQNVKTMKKGFTFLIKPEKDKAKNNPKIIENAIINASINVIVRERLAFVFQYIFL